MKLEQLEIENFKCFKSKKTFDFGRITVLTGANSSGKSTVMQAILGAVQTDGFPFYYSPNGKYVNLGDFKEMASFNNKENKPIVLGIKESHINITTYFSCDEISFLPKLQYIEYIDSSAVVKIAGEDILTFKFNFKDIFTFDSEVQDIFRKVNIVFAKKNKGNFLELSSDRKNFVLLIEELLGKNELNSSHILSIVRNILVKIFNHFKYTFTQEHIINYIGPYRNQPNRTYLEKNMLDFKVGIDGEGYIDQIVDWEKRSNGKIKKLVEVLKGLELIEEIKVNRLSGGRFEMLVKAKNSSILTSLTNVGFGISQFMPIIVADLQLSDDSTLFLAEPEIHLHPSIQSKFGDYLINQIKNTDKNYVIETHSEYLLNRLRLAIVKEELTKEDLKVYFLENKRSDTNVFDIDFTKTGAIKNAPDNFFETYAIDVMDIAMSAFAE